MKGRVDEAYRSLHYFRVGSFTEDQINTELEQIKNDVPAQEPLRTRWIQLWTHHDLFQRLWRASLLQFMAQMCGATAMKYYLPTLFRKLGIEYQLSLMIGGIESTLKIACTIFEMMVIDKFGRRNTMVAGSAAMSIGMLVSQSKIPSLLWGWTDKTRSMALCRWHTQTM